MKAEEEFGLKVYLTKETVDRALINIKLLDTAAAIIKRHSRLEPESGALDDMNRWLADYEASK